MCLTACLVHVALKADTDLTEHDRVIHLERLKLLRSLDFLRIGLGSRLLFFPVHNAGRLDIIKGKAQDRLLRKFFSFSRTTCPLG